VNAARRAPPKKHRQYLIEPCDEEPGGDGLERGRRSVRAGAFAAFSSSTALKRQPRVRRAHPPTGIPLPTLSSSSSGSGKWSLFFLPAEGGGVCFGASVEWLRSSFDATVIATDDAIAASRELIDVTALATADSAPAATVVPSAWWAPPSLSSLEASIVSGFFR